jgi:hypothetical protein
LVGKDAGRIESGNEYAIEIGGSGKGDIGLARTKTFTEVHLDVG